MKEVTYSVPIGRLYKVIESCNFVEGSKWCPVLLRIQPDLKEGMMQLPEFAYYDDVFEYLLQVWNLKGEMVYERQMARPVINWNVVGDIFLFQEAPERHSDSMIHMVRLFEDKKPDPLSFRLQLPKKEMDFLKDRSHATTWDPN